MEALQAQEQQLGQERQQLQIDKEALQVRWGGI